MMKKVEIKDGKFMYDDVIMVEKKRTHLMCQDRSCTGSLALYHTASSVPLEGETYGTMRMLACPKCGLLATRALDVSYMKMYFDDMDLDTYMIALYLRQIEES